MVWTGELRLVGLILGKCASHCADLPQVWSAHHLQNCCASTRKHSLLVSDVRYSAVTTLVDYSHFVLPVRKMWVGATDEDQLWLMQGPNVRHALSSMAYKPLLELRLADI